MRARWVCFILFVCMMAQAAHGQEYDDARNRRFLETLKLAQVARQRDDMPEYERLLRDASELRRLDEWDIRALSWCIRRQNRPAEALKIAQINLQWNPCIEAARRSVSATSTSETITPHAPT